MAQTINANAPVTIRRASAIDLPRVEQLLRSSDLPTIGVPNIIEDFLVASRGRRVGAPKF